MQHYLHPPDHFYFDAYGLEETPHCLIVLVLHLPPIVCHYDGELVFLQSKVHSWLNTEKEEHILLLVKLFVNYCLLLLKVVKIQHVQQHP